MLAADRLAQHIRDLMRVIIASKYYLLEREEDALVWLSNQFDGAAAYQWGLVQTSRPPLVTSQFAACEPDRILRI